MIAKLFFTESTKQSFEITILTTTFNFSLFYYFKKLFRYFHQLKAFNK